MGIKVNVIMGYMFPAGTVYRNYFDKGVRHLGEPPVPQKPELESVLIGDPGLKEEAKAESSTSADPLRDFLMGNNVNVEKSENSAETVETVETVETAETAPEAPELAPEATEMAPEATPESGPVEDRIEPHPDLLIGGEPSISEEPEIETPNSEDENESEG